MAYEESTSCVAQGYALTRRTVIGGGVSLLALVTRQPFAQNADRSSPAVGLFLDALKVHDFAVNVHLKEIDSEMFTYLMLDYNARKNALSVANELGFFSNQESATAYVWRIPEILPKSFPITYDEETLESQVVVIAALAERKLPIAPMPQAVTPETIPSVLPQTGKENPDLIVVGDIILETLGVSLGNKSLIEAFIESDDRIGVLLNDVVSAISSKEWAEVVSLAEQIFKLFIGRRIWSELMERRGRKIAFRLALRSVPSVGWIYCAASFCVSVKKNWYRFSWA